MDSFPTFFQQGQMPFCGYIPKRVTGNSTSPVLAKMSVKFEMHLLDNFLDLNCWESEGFF